MSHIHNLTSHLKNTTITPAPTPQLTYQLAQNGLKIYQANPMQQNHIPTATRMIRPQPTTPNYTHRPISTSLQTTTSPGRKGINYAHRIIGSNAITLIPTTPNPTPNHFTNSTHNANNFTQSLHHPQLMQHQAKKPTILSHPQQRGPTPVVNQQFVNHIPAHQFQPTPQPHHKSGGGGLRYSPPNNNLGHQLVNHHQISVYDSPRQFQIKSGQYNSPTKGLDFYSGMIPPPGLSNGDIKPITTTVKQTNNVKKISTTSGQGGQSKMSNNSSGGAARVQHVVNQKRKSIPNNLSPSKSVTESGLSIKKEIGAIPSGAKFQAKKQLGTGVAQRLPTLVETKMPTPVIVKTEDIPKGNITTEGVLRGPRPYQKGDDVLLTTEDGTFLFGTVGMVHGQTLQIMFGDGTQQLASFNKVKLLSCSVEEEEDDEGCNKSITADLTNHVDVDTTTIVGSKNVSSKSSKAAFVGNGTSSSNLVQVANEEVTCGSCGVVKKVAGKKALNYAPHTKTQFNCRRCVNKSRFGNKGSSVSLNSSQTPNRGKSSSTSTSPNSASKSSNHRRSSDDNSPANKCFHCEKTTNNNDRLHCNLCERACHLSCLAMTPTPLEGDRFWDVICSACGTQNGDSSSTARSKVFSCRRSISSWSDVAHLILSCLASDPENGTGERFFDLEKDIIPFIMKHTDRLHLPRTYKNIQPESRKEFLGTALHNATLRFLNGAEVHRKESLWAIRENNNHQGYPLRVIAAGKSPLKNKAKVPPLKSPTTPNGARLMRTPNNKWTSGTTTSSPAGFSSATKEGNSSRTKDCPPLTNPGARNSPKGKSPKEDDYPPELDKYDAPFITGSSPCKSSRVMSQTERLVQKAKKTCLKTKEGGIDSNQKRKASDAASSGGSPQSKRLKLSPENGMNGLTRTPTNKIPSPIPNKQFAQWLDCLNSNGRKMSPVSNIGSPVLSEASSSLFGKAVKSAGITPPGNYTSSPEKPSLRLRKPKPFDLKGKEKGNKFKVNGMVPPKLFAKLKGRLGGKQPKSNAATARFSQIPCSNGAVQAEDLSDTTQTEFSIFDSHVEDFIQHGLGFTIHCLPENPISTEKELQLVKKKVAAAYASEASSAPPAYLNYTRSSGAKSNTKERSKKDLKNLRSYEVTGRRIDAKGQIHYHLEWKDGYGNDSDTEDEDEPLLDWDDLNDPDIILEAADKLEVVLNGHHVVPSLDLRGQIEEDTRSYGDDADISIGVKEKATVTEENVEPIPVPTTRLHLGKNLKGSERDKIVIDLTCDD